MAPNAGGNSAQARLREALAAGGPGAKEKGPPVADGTLSVTPDTPEAIEFRTRRSTFDSVGASSSYLEDDTGPKPSELYGKFTWKIENFSDVQKRELRSNVFEVGSYKWYILVYPQGCDVSNHLSLFLCVADYDKLLPGWSHFAQFTIAVVNKDPKKSKYSDTLHRFCKKEHDWGWKKFMELNKVLEGFTVNNTLLIKAQVQVIRDRPHAPFRCLDSQYRRELVRVYLTNVETICRKFVDEKKADFVKLRGDLHGFQSFLSNLDAKRRKVLAVEKGETVLKAIVKRFFNEKEVTSTLVMDALFSGCKQLEDAGRQSELKKGKKERPGAVILAEKNVFTLVGDLNGLLERVVSETIPLSHHDKAGDQLSLRNAQDADEYSKDYVDRDEGRLANLGRKAIEVLAISLIFNELRVAYNEALSLKLQDQLIREEEEAERKLDERQASKLATEREKKARKKERRRAKKVEEEAQSSESKPVEAHATIAAESSQPQSSGHGSQQVQALNGSDHSLLQAAENLGSGIPQCSTTPSSAEISTRSEEHQPSTVRSHQDSQTGAGSQDRSDDEISSTSRSASEERVSITPQQYEDHIEYLKSQLSRVVSQLNSARAEVEESKELLRNSHGENASLRAQLAASQAALERASSRPSDAKSSVSRLEDQAGSSRDEATSSDPTVDPKIELPASHRQNNAISAPEGPSLSRGSGGKSRTAWNTAAAIQDQEFQIAGRSRSGQMATQRQHVTPPPPPPTEPRTNGGGLQSAIARQPSAQQQANGASSHRGTSGRSTQNGKRAQDPAAVSRKLGNQLNGNATAFVPSGGMTNGGNHMISYRNVAAGLVSTPSTGELPDASRLPQVVALRGLEGTVQKSGSSLPATPRSSTSRSGDAGTPQAQKAPSTLGPNPSVLLTNPSSSLGAGSAQIAPPGAGNLGTDAASFSPKSFGLGGTQQGNTAFAPTPGKRPDASKGMESPGLDDFAHMGLITDLLE